MKLDFEKIKELVVGSVDTWQEADGLHFAKCTKQQLAVWEKISPELLNNARATTGVRLDFHTNADCVEVETLGGGRYEVKIDGVLTHQFETGDGDGRLYIPLENNGKTKRVVVSMPSHFKRGGIRSLSISDGADIYRHTFDKKILFLGDSITQGFNSRFDNLSFAYLVSDFLNAESVIQGIGGSFFEPETVLDIGFDADIVFVAYGTNDFMVRHTLQELKAKEEAYLTNVKSRYPNAKIFLISPVWRQDFARDREVGSFRQCCEEIKAVAARLSVEVIDGDKMIIPFEACMADTVHPNDLGFAVYALNVLKEIDKKSKKAERIC